MDDKELEQMPIQSVDQFLRDRIKSGDLRVSELTDILIRKAILLKTSDIHIEPSRRGVRVRCRIDGALQELAVLPTSLHDQIVARIKVLADLMTHLRGRVQEGRITFKVAGKTQDLRVSIVPTVAGENAVLRMFSSSQETFEINRLGYRPEIVRQILNIVFDLRGMLLMAGPSGSGKTTTLYSIMLQIARKMDEYASMITIEDPVEYEFGLFPQVQVDRNSELNFATGLAAILRQDPEVIMVGEIRDTETANVGLRAALTGHLVLSTIHAGSACETVTRLINMGIEPFIVASALSGVIAQSLVRKICKACAEIYSPDPSKIEFFKSVMNSKKLPDFQRGQGCDVCDGTAYAGRLPISELLEVDDELRRLVLSKAQTSEIRQLVDERGWTSMLVDGLEKASEGQTTIDEIFRVVSLREVPC